MRSIATALLAFSMFLIACATTTPPMEKPISEARGTWISTRSRGTNWDSTMAALSKAGFNIVFPRMSTGGTASYESRVLPRTTERDELALCIEAAHKHGIEVHVWRINWYTSGAPDSFSQIIREQGRAQLSSQGKDVGQVMVDHGYYRMKDWLCPSQEKNRRLEHDAMLELVELYPVDGVHFDYMRYADKTLCYCDSCKINFTAESGLETTGWPEAFAEGGKYYEVYQDWRRSLIHSLAREIAQSVHRLDPHVCVSLAGRSGISWARESDAQEWWKWVNEGILDIICPMDYHTDPERFAAAVTPQMNLTRGAAPFYTGIGMYEIKSFGGLKKNVDLGRGLGQDGFVTFDLASLLPVLEQVGRELTPGKALLPHRAPEARFMLDEPGARTEHGFPVFAAGEKIGFRAVVMMKAKLREGITRVAGDVILEKVTGETVSTVGSLDLDRADVREMSVTPPSSGRYRLALVGRMTLSTGERRPFIVRSFPFEVKQ